MTLDYLTSCCCIWNSISAKFPYLVQKKFKEGQEVRRVAQLDWKIIEENCEKPFVASGLQFIPLPVSYSKFPLFMVIVCYNWFVARSDY